MRLRVRTEDQWKQKICPFMTRKVGHATMLGDLNACDLIPCLGSKCAAWVEDSAQRDQQQNKLITYGTCAIMEKY